MKLTILITLISSAAAFMSSSPNTAASTSALSMAFKDALGAQKPFGFYDPLNLVADGDQANFDRLYVGRCRLPCH
jgi:hypothetical protein